MLRRASILALAALLSTASGASYAETPAKRAAVSFAAVFDIYLGGLKLAEMRVDASRQGTDYDAEADLITAGALGVFYTAGFEARAQGSVAAKGWQSASFAADSYDSNKRQSLEMRYGARGPSVLTAKPPFKPKPWQVDPMAQTGTVDPLTGAVAALSAQPRERLCQRTVEIFDGRRRYRIELGKPEAAGEAEVLCPAIYERIGGFKPKKMKEPTFPFRMWFAPRADGLWEISRAAGDTPFGTATMVKRTPPS